MSTTVQFQSPGSMWPTNVMSSTLVLAGQSVLWWMKIDYTIPITVPLTFLRSSDLWRLCLTYNWSPAYRVVRNMEWNKSGCRHCRTRFIRWQVEMPFIHMENMLVVMVEGGHAADSWLKRSNKVGLQNLEAGLREKQSVLLKERADWDLKCLGALPIALIAAAWCHQGSYLWCCKASWTVNAPSHPPRMNHVWYIRGEWDGGRHNKAYDVF